MRSGVSHDLNVMSAIRDSPRSIGVIFKSIMTEHKPGVVCNVTVVDDGNIFCNRWATDPQSG